MAGRGGLVAEPKIAGSLTQSSQRKTMQAASSQLIKRLSTTRLKRSVSFGQEKKNPQSSLLITFFIMAAASRNRDATTRPPCLAFL